MGLLQVETTTITSPTASFSIGGIDDNSTYMLAISNANVQNQNEDIFMRVGTSSGADTSANYDYASKTLYSGGLLQNYGVNQGYFSNVFINMRSSAGNGNGIMYLHNFYDSSSSSFITLNNVHRYTASSHVYGVQGGGVHTVNAQQTHIYLGYGGNITSGTYTIYKVV